MYSIKPLASAGLTECALNLVFSVLKQEITSYHKELNSFPARYVKLMD